MAVKKILPLLQITKLCRKYAASVQPFQYPAKLEEINYKFTLRYKTIQQDKKTPLHHQNLNVAAYYKIML